MKKVILFLVVLCFFLPNLAQSAQDLSARSLAADQLFIYAQAVYERGDKSQAERMFQRVLALNPKHPGAMRYVKDIKPALPSSDEQLAHLIQGTNNFMQSTAKLDNFATNYLSSSKTNAELQQNVQEADRAIAMLQSDIQELRNQLNHTQEGSAS